MERRAARRSAAGGLPPAKRLDLALAGTARASRAEDGDAVFHGRHEVLLAEEREEWTREPFEGGAGVVIEPAAHELELGGVSRPMTVLSRGRLDGLDVGSARAPAP